MRLDEIEPSARALELADDRDPRHVEAILQESVEVVRVRPPLVITETRHGFICASAGVDASNAKGQGTLVLLPLDPDASAAAIRDGLRERFGCDVGVIVSDSFGRPFRQGTTDVALGAAGITPLLDLRGVARPRRLRAPGHADRRRRRACGRRRARARQVGRNPGRDRPRPRPARAGCRPRHRHPGRPRSVSLGLDASTASAASRLPITGANLKPWPLHGEPDTTCPVRSSRNRRPVCSCRGTSPCAAGTRPP